MDPYEKEIFNFFSQQENFENMIKVAEHYPKVKKTLQSQFWALVEEKLRKLNAEKGDKWSIRLTGDIFLWHTKLMLYKSYWAKGELLPPVAIGVERLAADNFPYYGLWVNKDAATLDYEGVMRHAKALPIKTGYEDDSDGWWPFWKGPGIDFSVSADYVKILPENREELVESVARQIFELATELEDELDVMAAMKK